MPREGRLNGDLRRLLVANLADENDVGVLAHDGPKRGTEGEAGAFVHLDLHDAWQAVLDGILDGDDVHATRLDLPQRRIQGRRLAGPRWARDQQEPLALLEQLPDAHEIRLREADGLEGPQARRSIEHAHDDLLPVRHGERGHAKVHDGAEYRDPSPAILRPHTVRDIQPRQDLHA